MPQSLIEFYDIAELSEHWNIRKKWVKHYIETGKLRTCIWLRSSLVTLGQMKKYGDGRESLEVHTQKWMKGFGRRKHLPPELAGRFRWTTRLQRTRTGEPAGCLNSRQLFDHTTAFWPFFRQPIERKAGQKNECQDLPASNSCHLF